MKLFNTCMAAAVLGVSGVAAAGTYEPTLDYTFQLNNGDAFNVTNVAANFSVIVPVGGMVTGFSFEGTLWADQSAFPAFPRQTQLTITAPDSTTYIIGGDPAPGATWDFQTATGSNNVTYNHGIGGEAWGGDGLPDFGLPNTMGAGEWQFSFVRVGGFPATLQWSDVSITLHAIPAPGALALLGLAGLAGHRRRRA